MQTDAKQASHDLVTSADRASEQAVLHVLLDAGGYDALPGLVAVPRPPRRTGPPPTVPASAALVSVGQPYSLQTRADVLRVAATLVPRLRAIRMTGAAASELLGLAGGECDAFLGFGLAPWDITAGAAIVRACGGTTHSAPSPIGIDVLGRGDVTPACRRVGRLGRRDWGKLTDTAG